MGGGVEGEPGEPEVVAVEEGSQALAGQGALDGVAEEVPAGAGFGVDDFVVGEFEGELSVVDVGGEDAGSADGASIGVFSQVLEGGEGFGLVEDDDVDLADGAVDDSLLGKGLVVEGDAEVVDGYAYDPFHGGQGDAAGAFAGG